MPSRRAGLDQAVRVEHERVAGTEHGLGVDRLDLGGDAEQRAGDVELLDAAVGAQDERGRMPGAGEHHAEGVAVAIEPGQRRAREARVARLLLLQHDLVDDLQRGGRLARLGARAQRVAHDARHAGRARVLALDVADRDPDRASSPIAKTS